MKKKIAIVSLAAVLAAGPAFASGFRIPEQSINSVALSNAYTAHTPNADASYYNPANMSWLADQALSEASFTWIHLASIEYTDGTSAARNGGSRSEDFVLPNLHLVSPAYNNFRFGLSVVYPYGLSKRWESPFPKASAEEFTLKTYELNPTVSYKISDSLSIGGGLRAIYAEGKVKSSHPLYARDLDGDTTEYGYNLALTYRPLENLSLAATYRSKVELDVEGDARLFAGGIQAYSGYAEVMVPTPAVLTLATAYTCNSGRTTAEFTYDKTFWNSYDQLNFNYAQAFTTLPLVAFDAPLIKNWVNAEAFRLGLTHRCTDRLTAMLGFAIDKTPVPDQTLGFELPDSDAKIYSFGLRYQYSDNLQLGAAYLYDDKESRSVLNYTPLGTVNINGTFENSAAHLFTAGLQYRF